MLEADGSAKNRPASPIRNDRRHPLQQREIVMQGSVDRSRRQPEDAWIAESEAEVRQFSLADRQPHAPIGLCAVKCTRVLAQTPGEPPSWLSTRAPEQR